MSSSRGTNLANFRTPHFRFDEKLRRSLFLRLIYGTPFTLFSWDADRDHPCVHATRTPEAGVRCESFWCYVPRRRRRTQLRNATVAWRITRCRLRGDISIRLRVSGASTRFRYNSRHRSAQYGRVSHKSWFNSCGNRAYLFSFIAIADEWAEYFFYLLSN